MQNKINIILDQYKIDIGPVESADLNEFSNVELGINISRNCLQKLRIAIRTNEFESQEEEIDFFKNIKPYVYSRLKFYAKLYNFLIERPTGSIKSQRNFIDQELKKLHIDAKRNVDFIKYYREKSNTLDAFYFVRGRDNISLVSNTSHFYTDAEFSTSHDHTIAKIMAYDLLNIYYNQELNNLGLATTKDLKKLNYCADLNLKCTATKTDLVELIYALQSTGAIKDGKGGLKEMANACEQMFDIDLGNFYRTYIEIRARKLDRTTFLNSLKNSFERQMNEDDEKS